MSVDTEGRLRDVLYDRVDLEWLALEIESFAEPMGTEDPTYLRGKQAGLRLAAAIARNARERSP